jgi:pilus assembly protein CpaE
MPSTDKIRVIIVDDIAETRENIRRLLQFDLTIEVVSMARNGQEAIDLSADLKPDVVIMDINMPDMDGITATEAIKRKVPYIQIVILSVQSDPSYMRRAMLAGARDFLTKPPSIDDLTAAIHRAGNMASDEKQKQSQSFQTSGAPGSPAGIIASSTLGKVIVVYSPKGGVGTTTIAVNLALSLHSEQSRALLVDGSLQFGDVAVFLNEQVKNSVLDLAPRADELDSDVVEGVVLTNVASGLHILAAPPRPEMADKVNGDQFGKMLRYLRQVYSYIVVDTSPYLTEPVQAALEVSDIIVLITTQDIPSIKNANSFMSLTDASGIKRDKILFVMNRFDKRIGISPERVGESLRQPIVITIPLEERIISNSVNRGVPFVLDNKAHPNSKCIFMLADLIRERIEKLETQVESASKKA